MRKLQYLVRISKDPNSDWGASVPDLSRCVATGKTIDAALQRIERSVALHLRGMREDALRPLQPRHRAIIPRRTPHQVDFFATIEVAADSRVAVVAQGVRLHASVMLRGRAEEHGWQ